MSWEKGKSRVVSFLSVFLGIVFVILILGNYAVAPDRFNMPLLLSLLIPTAAILAAFYGFQIWDDRRRLRRVRSLRLVVTEDGFTRSSSGHAEKVAFSDIQHHRVLRENGEVIGQVVRAVGKTFDLSNLERQNELADLLAARLVGRSSDQKPPHTPRQKVAVALGTLTAGTCLFLFIQGSFPQTTGSLSEISLSLMALSLGLMGLVVGDNRDGLGGHKVAAWFMVVMGMVSLLVLFL